MDDRDRDALIAHAARAWRRTCPGTRANVMDTAGLRAVLDAIAPLIRADERERIAAAIEADEGIVDRYLAARIARNGSRDG